jgi:hypothetical protein
MTMTTARSLAQLFAPALIAATMAAPAMAQDVQFELYNDSALTVMEIYTSPSSSDSWGPDILGSGVIGAGTAGSIYIGDGSSECIYDILFVMEDGQQLSDTIDICTTASYTLY